MHVSSKWRTASTHDLRVFSFFASLSLTWSFNLSLRWASSWSWRVVSSKREVVSLNKQFNLMTFCDHAQKDSLLGSRCDLRILLCTWSSQSGWREFLRRWDIKEVKGRATIVARLVVIQLQMRKSFSTCGLDRSSWWHSWWDVCTWFVTRRVGGQMKGSWMHITSSLMHVMRMSSQCETV